MEDAFTKLLKGYRSFRENSALRKEFFHDLHLGQNPQTLVISCCDSRVVPNIIMQAEPGEMFITRNIAGLVPPYDTSHTSYHATSAAIEYAVLHLKVKHIIIMGHKGCGGIAALIERQNKEHSHTDFIDKWMKIAKPALAAAESSYKNLPSEQKAELCEREALKISIKNLLTFPCVAQAAAEKKLQIHAMMFDIKEFSLSLYDPAKDVFELIK